MDKWLQGTKKKAGAIKHPGALTRAAKEHGRSKAEEAKVEAHSPNKRIRGRGILGERLLGIAKKGNIKKGRKKPARKRG